MTTLWKDKTTDTFGDRVEDAREWSPDGRGAVLLHSGRPDRVRHPVTGQELRVRRQARVELGCPSCGAAGPKDVLELEARPTLYVCVCKSCHQFSWFTLRNA